MKTETTGGRNNQWVIPAICKTPILLNKLIDLEKIRHPEWEHFSVIKANDSYMLFEGTGLVFYSPSYDSVKMELIERMHFHELKLKTNQKNRK